ncbi:inositol monophosphatase family protein [Mycetocola saprophilus]|uniref:inositol monophosphatase family protein n=1 Tax=Mycetocola saprophilus TaxID=76636 RepID=UPI00068DC184|nr:inositol monophosphatase family protein [Mycetocola saprophilus]
MTATSASAPGSVPASTEHAAPAAPPTPAARTGTAETVASDHAAPTEHAVPAALRALAESAALRVREHILERRRTGIGAVDTKSSAIDVVTEVDREAEHLLRDILLTARPEDGFLGEEGTAQIAGTSGIVWVVDPIDGTTNFVTGAGPFAVSVAAVSAPGDPARWRAYAGAIALCLGNTATELFSAHAGGGATADGRTVRVLAGADLSAAIIATGLAYDPAIRRRQAATLEALTPRVRDLRIGGSAAADLCAVAAGHVAAYVERGLAPWDWAAGALIVTEAGGVLAGETGDRPDAELLLAGGAGIVATLRSLV